MLLKLFKKLHKTIACTCENERSGPLCSRAFAEHDSLAALDSPSLNMTRCLLFSRSSLICVTRSRSRRDANANARSAAATSLLGYVFAAFAERRATATSYSRVTLLLRELSSPLPHPFSHPLPLPHPLSPPLCYVCSILNFRTAQAWLASVCTFASVLTHSFIARLVSKVEQPTSDTRKGRTRCCDGARSYTPDTVRRRCRRRLKTRCELLRDASQR